MADNKKYIGEGKLPQEPNKKLTLKLKDGEAYIKAQGWVSNHQQDC